WNRTSSCLTGKEERIALAVPSWRNQARCRNVPEEELNAFFPWTSGESDRAEPSDIRKVTETYCKGCPVRDECLDFAVNFGCQGIWRSEEHTSELQSRENLV